MITEFKIFEQEENIIYRLGKESDLIDIKKISNQLRTELGFVMNVVLKIAIDCDELIVAEDNGTVIGFVHFHRRKDTWNTVHELGVRKDYQGKGIGKKLFNMVPKPVRLKTTMDNTKANDFYKLQGMRLFGTEAGKKRGLNVWVKENINHEDIDPYNEEDWNDDEYQIGDKLICKEAIYSSTGLHCLYHVGKIYSIIDISLGYYIIPSSWNNSQDYFNDSRLKRYFNKI